MIAHLRQTHFLLFALLLCWAPVPLGSNRPGSWLLLGLAAGLLMLGWALLGGLERSPAPVGLRWITLPLLLFSVTLGWGLAQAWGGVSALDPAAARDGVLREMSYGAIAFLALQYGRSARLAARLVTILAAAGALQAVYGLAVFLSGSETILGMEKWAYRGFLTGTFVNRNNFATFAGLALLCQIALAVHLFGGKGPRGIARMLVAEGDKRAWTVAAGGLATLAALLLSGSRGGCFATLYGGFVLTLSLRRITGWKMALAALAPLLLLAASIWLLRDGGAPASELDDRLAMDGLALQAIAARPWTGSGLGGFAAVFALMRPPRFLAVWDNVHDTYLQLALELGIPAASCLLGAIGLLVGRCAQGLRERRRGRIFPALGLAASALVGSHALVDFSAEIPAVAALYAAMLGLAVAQSWPESTLTADG